MITTVTQFGKIGASINVTWSTDEAADNYTIRVTPPVMPGRVSDFTTTDTSLQLMVVYNVTVNYFINITAKNCVGSNSAVVQLIVG